MMDDRDMERSETAYNDVSVVVKWFNPKKGFGFVQADDLFDGDAFLHISVARAAGGERVEGRRTALEEWLLHRPRHLSDPASGDPPRWQDPVR